MMRAVTSAPRSIHLVGICGTGMGTFAGLLKAAGHQVRGSDENVYPPMSDKLDEWGIEVRAGYRPENLDPAPDLVVIGNVIRRTNPEARAVMSRGLPYTSFAKGLGDLFLEGRHSVVVSGTHGKTTTTSLIGWLLTSAGKDPGFVVGGIPGNFGEGFRLGAGEHFVVEGDEYDTAYFDKVPKFLHYRPRSLFLTSLEFDHADIYEDIEAIEAEFHKLVDLVPSDGRVFACASAPRIMKCARHSSAPIETYTAREGVLADWFARDIETSSAGSSFTVMRDKVSIGRFEYPMTGLHNVENAVAAVAFGVTSGLSVSQIKTALETFEGVARRQTVRATIGGVRIIDDFAHHPTTVKETVRAIRDRYSDGRLFAIFEPRSATSSRKYFQQAYADAFFGADVAIIARVGKEGIPTEELLDVDALIAAIERARIDARAAPNVDEIVRMLADEARAGDTLLFMSNGGFGGIYDKIEAALTARG